MRLKLNYNRMGMRPKGDTWEWFTAEAEGVCTIHIHNENVENRWQYIIRTIQDRQSKPVFNTKEEAFEAALTNAIRLLKQGINHLEVLKGDL